MLFESKNLSFSYSSKKNKIPALAGIDIQVPLNQKVAFMGPNGSGKSTLLKILSGQLAAFGGDLKHLSKDFDPQTKEFRQSMAICFQSASLDPWLSVEENIYCYTSLFSLSRTEVQSRMNSLLEIFDLEAKKTSLVKTLSGGQARKVELLKSLLVEPAVLFLDEPTTGLDPVARRDFFELLEKAYQRRPFSILLATHLIAEAEQCDYLFLMAEGKLLKQTRLQDIQLGNQEIIDLQVSKKEEAFLFFDKNKETEEECVHLANGEIRIKSLRAKWWIQELQGQAWLSKLSWRKANLEDLYFSLAGEALRQ